MLIALPGVLISAVKLIAFHGCFSWITFRALALPLTYTVRLCCTITFLAESALCISVLER